MEEKLERSPIQMMRDQIAGSCPNLPEYKIIEMCTDYGINFDIPDTNTLRIFMLLASAERALMKLREE